MLQIVKSYPNRKEWVLSVSSANSSFIDKHVANHQLYFLFSSRNKFYEVTDVHRICDVSRINLSTRECFVNSPLDYADHID